MKWFRERWYEQGRIRSTLYQTVKGLGVGYKGYMIRRWETDDKHYIKSHPHTYTPRPRYLLFFPLSAQRLPMPFKRVANAKAYAEIHATSGLLGEIAWVSR